MARNSYTFRTEWTAYAELDDFKRIKEAQDLVLHETEHKPKERHLISALVTNLLFRPLLLRNSQRNTYRQPRLLRMRRLLLKPRRSGKGKPMNSRWLNSK